MRFLDTILGRIQPPKKHLVVFDSSSRNLCALKDQYRALGYQVTGVLVVNEVLTRSPLRNKDGSPSLDPLEAFHRRHPDIYIPKKISHADYVVSDLEQVHDVLCTMAKPDFILCNAEIKHTRAIPNGEWIIEKANLIEALRDVPKVIHTDRARSKLPKIDASGANIPDAMGRKNKLDLKQMVRDACNGHAIVPMAAFDNDKPPAHRVFAAIAAHDAATFEPQEPDRALTYQERIRSRPREGRRY